MGNALAARKRQQVIRSSSQINQGQCSNNRPAPSFKMQEALRSIGAV